MSDIDYLDILEGALERVDAQLDARDPRLEEIKRDRELKARVFNTVDGRKLIASWLEEISIGKGVSAESTLIEVGIFEGRRQMIREIITATKQVEEASQ